MADKEKDGSLGDTGHSSAISPPSISSEGIGEEMPPEVEPIRGWRSRRASRSSRPSDDSDPLSPLELALSNGSLGYQEVTAVRTMTSIGSSASRPPDYEVLLDEGDPENPRNWPLWYRAWVIFAISYTTWVVVFYSTSYTVSIPGLMEAFDVSNTSVATLGLTTYLLGLAAGSLLVAPTSELYGRRPVYIVCLVCFTLLVIPCCLATSIEEMIVVRFFGYVLGRHLPTELGSCINSTIPRALFGAVMVANSAGSVVDVSTEEYRALTMSLWSIAPMNGPVTGPVIGGFVYQYLGWQWDNWLVLILASVGTICMTLTKETYAPVILQRKASRIRKETNDERWWSRYDMKISKAALLRINLLRPFQFAFTEPILWFFNIW